MIGHILIVICCVVCLLRYLAYEFEWLDRQEHISVYDCDGRQWTTHTLYKDKHWRSHGLFLHSISVTED